MTKPPPRGCHPAPYRSYISCAPRLPRQRPFLQLLSYILVIVRASAPWLALTQSTIGVTVRQRTSILASLPCCLPAVRCYRWGRGWRSGRLLGGFAREKNDSSLTSATFSTREAAVRIGADDYPLQQLWRHSYITVQIPFSICILILKDSSMQFFWKPKLK